MSVNIDNLYIKFTNDIKANPSLEYGLNVNVQKMNHYVQMHYIQKHEQGFCSKFVIPDRDINVLFIDFPSITDVEINNAFIIDWKVPARSHMHTNLYYHKLLLVVFHAVKTNNNVLGERALALILYRIWNGRLSRLVKWCNPEIMAAAVSVATNRLIKKYNNPLDLMQQYFAKTIYEKYKSYLIRDSVETKRLFEQTHNRVKQVFGSNSQIDLTTGEAKYTTGLQPEYYKAHANKNKISKIGSSEDSDDKFSYSELEGTIEHVARFITTYKQVNYDTKFINMVTSNIKGLSVKSVNDILIKIHQLKYNDLIREIVEIIFRRLRGIPQYELCSTKMFDHIKTKVISSKNTRDVEFLKQITDKLLDSIFKNDFANKSYNTYLDKSDNHKSQIRSIIFYGIGYNIQKATCEYK